MSPERLPNVALCLMLALVAVLTGVAPICATGTLAVDPSTANAQSVTGRLMFIENAGQWPTGARFQVWGGRQMQWLANDAIWMTILGKGEASPQDLAAGQMPGSYEPFVLQRALHAMPRPYVPTGVNIRLSFPGANPDVRIEPFDPLSTTVSYFLGNYPAQWRPAVPVYGVVRYVDLYPGVDLVLGGADAAWQLEAQPGAETSTVRLRIEGGESALLAGDKLRLTTVAGVLDLALPAANVALQAEVISATGQPATFDLQPASPHAVRRTVPQAPGDGLSDLIYSTFLGGSSWDQVNAIAVDGAGQATVAGLTKLSTFPTTPGAFDPSYNGGDHDVFVARLSADGSSLVYSTFLGGSGEGSDSPDDVAVDSAGQATGSGVTPSGDFPTTPGAYDKTHGGGTQPFVTRLNANGSALIFSTFFSGPINALAVDYAGQTILAGVAGLNSFPTTPDAYDRTFGGGTCGASPNTYPCPDAFVARLSADGRTLVYSTFLGGSGSDTATAVAVDSADRISVAGSTSSGDFPTTPGAYDRSYHGGTLCGTPPAPSYPCPDVFVARLSADGHTLSYGTFLGGESSDNGYALGLDSAGRAIVGGMTASFDFPTTPGAYDPSWNWGIAGYVSKLDLYAPNVLAPIEQPGPGAIIAGTVTLAGFAVDLDSLAGTGVDGVDVYLDGASGTGTLIGHAIYGLSRPDVAARYGVRFGPSGWELAWDTIGLAPGVHRLYLYAHRTTDGAWSELAPRLVIVPRGQVVWLPLIRR